MRARATKLRSKGRLPPECIWVTQAGGGAQEAVRLGATTLPGLPGIRRRAVLRVPVVVRSYYRWSEGTSRVNVMMRNRTRARSGWTPKSVGFQVSEFLARAGPHHAVKDETADGGLLQFQRKHPRPADSDWTASSFRIDGRERSFRLVVLEEDWLALGTTEKFDVAIEGCNVDRTGLEFFTTGIHV
jgi:hypothetical protein